MPNSHQKSTGTQNTLTVGLLVAAIFLSPVLTFMFFPVGYLSTGLAFAGTGMFLVLARMSRRRHSALSMPSFAESLAVEAQTSPVPTAGRQ